MSTITATGVTYDAVNIAVSLAVNGDTVQVPAGSATWNSTLNVGTKAISIIGAGSGSTIITNNVGTLFEFQRTGNTLVRLSGFRFNSSWFHEPVISLVGPISKVRIDHCIFDKAQTGIASNYLNKNADGPVYGVVDHCQFINMGGHGAYFAMDVRRGESSLGPHWGQAAWEEATINPIQGTDKMLYFEDCQFTYTSELLSCNNVDSTIYGQYGGRVCLRYNTFNGFAYPYIDAHGDTPEWSTLYYEIYNNTFVVGPYTGSLGATAGSFANQRGGMRITHDNTFTGGKRPVEFMVYWINDVRIVSNTYFWGNTLDGDTNQANMVAIVDSGQTFPGFSAAHIRLDHEYFLHAPVSYTPLAYPHPLINLTPAAIISVTPSVLKFDTIIAGGATTGSAGVQNIGNLTLTGSASTSSPFQITSSSVYSVPPSQSADMQFRYASAAAGNHQQSAVFTGGGGATIQLKGTTAPLLLDLNWVADEGTITAPFTASGGHVSQVTENDNYDDGGQAIYGFTVVTPGDYKILVNVNAPNGGANSFFVNIDGQPIQVRMVWDIAQFTSGYEDRYVTWRDNPTSPKVFTLTAGQHLLIIRGREPGVSLANIQIIPTIAVTPPDIPSNPSPVDGEQEVVTSTSVAWTGNGATYVVRFGTSNPPPQVAAGQVETSYNPGALQHSTTYFWQIVASNTGGSTQGPVWSFMTAEPKEGDPISSPSPQNGAVGVMNLTPTLRWNGVGTSYDIAFGTSPTPSVVSTSQINNFYIPSTLSYSTTYHWSVLAHRDDGDEQGPIWSFTTAAAPVDTPVPKIIFVG